LQGCSETLPQPEHDAAFGGFFDRFGDARVVLLGEATIVPPAVV
jgi:erythromycin esterase-like protein